MKKTYRLEWYEFYDRDGMTRRLEAMARRGWMLERANRLFWTYRKEEPASLRFAAAYAPELSDFDPEPPEGREDFRRFCAHAGWQYVCSLGPIQFFSHSQPDPLPLDTDPVLETEVIHQTACRRYLRWEAVNLALLFLLVFRRFPAAWISLLASLPYLLLFLLLIAGLLTRAGRILRYLRWHRKACLAAERGEFLSPRLRRPWTACRLLYLLALFVCAGLSLDQALEWDSEAPAESASEERPEAEPNPETELRLTLADLGFSEAVSYTVSEKRQTSPFLERLSQSQIPEGPGMSQAPSLSYTRTQVRIPAVYGLCHSALLHWYDSSSMPFSYTPIDPAPWQAREAYRMGGSQESSLVWYLLCYEDTFVELWLNWEPTPEQQAVFREKLVSKPVSAGSSPAVFSGFQDKIGIATCPVLW